MVPAGTPRDVIARLHAESARAVQAAEVRERYAALGVEPVSNTPAQFAAYMQSEIVKWGKAVRGTGLARQ